jgi:hypothetical protein
LSATGIRDGVIVAKGAKLEAKTGAEPKRLKELERDYKVLKEEHALIVELRFTGDV